MDVTLPRNYNGIAEQVKRERAAAAAAFVPLKANAKVNANQPAVVVVELPSPADEFLLKERPPARTTLQLYRECRV